MKSNTLFILYLLIFIISFSINFHTGAYLSYAGDNSEISAKVNLKIPILEYSFSNIKFSLNMNGSLDYKKNKFNPSSFYDYAFSINLGKVYLKTSLNYPYIYPVGESKIYLNQNISYKFNENLFFNTVFSSSLEDIEDIKDYKLYGGFEYYFENSIKSKKSENIQNLKIFDIEGIVLAKIPYNSEIIEKNISILPRLEELKKQNSLLIFNGVSQGGKFLLKENFDNALKDAQQKISHFLQTKVISVKEDLKKNYKNINIESYNKFFLSITNTIQYGTIIVGKYYVDNSLGIREYHVLVLYDPYLFLKIIKNSKDYEEMKNSIPIDELLNLILIQLKNN